MNKPIIMEVMNNEIALDEKCWACDLEWMKVDGLTCGVCKGTGFEPTDAGRAIIALVERHIKGGKA